MSDAIKYCDVCGHLVQAGDVASGKALSMRGRCLCAKCFAALPDEARGELVRRSTPRPRRTPAPGARRTTTRRASKVVEKKKPPMLALAAVATVIGFAAILLVGLVLTDGEREHVPPPTAPAMPLVKVAPRTELVDVAVEAAPQPAVAEATVEGKGEDNGVVARLKALIDPTLSRYDAFIEAARKELAELPEGDERAAVEALVVEAKAQYAERAGRELASATDMARALAAKGDFDHASTAFTYVKMNYGSSDWFEETGKAHIARVLSEIEESRAAHVKRFAAKRGAAADHLVAWWRFDAKGFPQEDSSGNGHGAHIKDVEWSGAGRVGGGMRFMGAGRLKVDASKKLNPERITLAYWVKPDGFEKAQDVISQSPAGSYLIQGYPDKVFHNLRIGGKLRNVRFPYETGVWQHVAVTYDGTTIRGYKNGVEIARKEIAGAIEDTGRPLAFGGNPYSGLFFKGTLDDVRIYDRALTAVELEGLLTDAGDAPAGDTVAAVRSDGEASRTTPRKTAGAPKSAKPPHTRKSDPVVEKAPAAEVELPRGPREPLPGETGVPGQWAPGLIAEIFADHDLSKRTGVRIDNQIRYKFGQSAPDLNAEKDWFAIRWTGWLLVPYAGEYVFEAEGNDVLDVTLDGKPLVRGGGGDAKKRTPPVYCEAGLHPIRAVMKEKTGWATAYLRWQPEGRKKRSIPPEYYFHEVPEHGAMGPFAGVVEGLWAEYYTGENFKRKLAEAHVVDPNAEYGESPPVVGCSKDMFSVRMTGYFLASWKGKYRFDIDADDGIRMKVGDTLVVDRWGPADGSHASGIIELESGLHEITIEHFERTGGAKVYFWWVPPGYGDVTKKTFYYLDKHIWWCKPPTPRITNRRNTAPGIQGKGYKGARQGGKPLITTWLPGAWYEFPAAETVPGMPDSKYNYAWTGVLLVPHPGEFAFKLDHAGGVVLTIGGKTLVRKWMDSKGVETTSLRMRAGPVPLTLKYANVAGNAAARLSWSSTAFPARPVGPGDVGHVGREISFAAPWRDLAKLADAGDAPSTGAAAGAGAFSKDNWVINGGFETIDAEEKFPSSWRGHQWGKLGARLSVRADKTNPRTGDMSLVVRSFEADGKPGAFTSLQLDAGEYIVKYWACADIDNKATVGATLGGKELSPNVVGEEWQQFSERMRIDESKRGTLGLWTTTERVRVWFDDVELFRIK